MRPLSLHSSALNDAEYTLFTENLSSIVDSDGDPEAQALTIREVRAWMRGRYPAIPAATIDKILALFPSKDGISGAEFFAALRLVLHVEAGKDVDRALAFVQVHPDSTPAIATAPAIASSSLSQGLATPADEAVHAATPQRHNPFLPPTPSLTRSKTAPPAPAPVLPPRRTVPAPSAPVPPPRHPPLPPRSLSPPKPSTPAHITSTLMKQSLQASKTGQWLKQGQARLEQERVLQVLRSSSSTPRPAAATSNETDYMSASASSSDGSRGNPPSIPLSASSLEQVALASPSNSLQRAFDDAYKDREPPPTHPDRKSAPPSVISSRASASSGSSSRAHPQPSPEREKPRPPPKPRSLTSSMHAPISPFDPPTPQTRLTRSHSLRPSPPPPTARAGRVRPESVHALLGNLGSLRLAESPFGDPVRPHRARPEERESLVSRRQADEDESDSDSDDEEWVGVRRFEDSDGDSNSPDMAGVGGRRRPARQDTITPRTTATTRERDSLKWPVDVEGEGWRPL